MPLYFGKSRNLSTISGGLWQPKCLKTQKFDTSTSLGYDIRYMADTATVEVLIVPANEGKKL